jgi:WD40 repeat protein
MLRGHKGSIDGAVWSPDGKWLASWSNDDRMLKLWTSAGLCASTFELSQGLSKVAWSPDSKLIAAAAPSEDRWIWSRSSGKVVRVLQTTAVGADSFTEPHPLDWSPDGKWLAAMGPLSPNWPIRLWYIPTYRMERELRLRDGESKVYAMAWSPKATHLAVSTQMGSWLCRRSDGRLERVLETERGVLAFAWRPKGSTLAAACSDGTVGIWDLDLR